MASDHWRDLHRRGGRFVKRPGAKGFRAAPPKDGAESEAPPATAVDEAPKPCGLSAWVDRNRSSR